MIRIEESRMDIIRRGNDQLFAAVLEKTKNPTIVSELVIDCVERALPQIISELDIPNPMSRTARGMLHAKLTGRPGFRQLQGTSARNEAMEKLRAEKIRRILRITQSKIALQPTDTNTFSVTDVEDFGRGGSYPLHWLQGAATQAITTEVLARADRETEVIYSTETDRIEPSAQVPTQTSLAVQVEEGLSAESLKPELPEPLSGGRISGYKALLKQGRLLGFLRDVVEDLLPRYVEAIDVPDRPVYRSLNYRMLLDRYRSLAPAVTRSEPVPVELVKELRLVDALLDALDIEEHWAGINKRRFHLITKKHTRGLRAEEESELAKLQDLAGRRVATLAPLPFDELARLEEYAKKASLKQDSKESSLGD